MIEGVDYSSTPNANWTAVAAALKARGKNFAGRYAVSDKSPNGRGITADEYQALTAHGVDTFVYWEGSPSWMLGGEPAGIAAALNAQGNLQAAGMPVTMPIFFAHDIDPEPQHFDAIDACLRGAAKVIGDDRVALYGGWLIIDHCAAVDTARRFCQTVAWEYGRGVHHAACLYQYDTRNPQYAPQNSIAGIACDMVRALKEDYGQASRFVNTPQIPKYPDPILPDWYERADKRVSPSSAEWQGNRWYPQRMNVVALTQTYVYIEPDIKSAHAGDPIATDTKVPIRWTFEDAATGRQWLVSDDGYYAASKFTPMIPLPERRGR